MKKYIIPSLISDSQEELDAMLAKVIDHVQVIQIDVMDGKFVKSTHNLFDFQLPEEPKREYEAHILVAEPEEWIERYGDRVNVIYFPFEACTEDGKISDARVRNTISLIKNKGKQAGLSINPETSVEQVRPYLDSLDMVVIMTVHPGQYGAKFLPENLDKARQIKKEYPHLEIEVDGGITDKTIAEVAAAGANRFISGSFIMKEEDPSAQIKTLYDLIRIRER